MNGTINEHLPQDLTNIVLEYVNVLKHPVEYGFCAVCRIPYKFYTNLCNLHNNHCVLCLEAAEVDYNYVCKRCAYEFNTEEWMHYVHCATNGDVFSAMYKDDEAPIDIEYLISQAKMFTEILDEYEEKEEHLLTQYEWWGGLSCNTNVCEYQTYKLKELSDAMDKLKDEKPKFAKTELLIRKL